MKMSMPETEWVSKRLGGGHQVLLPIAQKSIYDMVLTDDLAEKDGPGGLETPAVKKIHGHAEVDNSRYRLSWSIQGDGHHADQFSQPKNFAAHHPPQQDKSNDHIIIKHYYVHTSLTQLPSKLPMFTNLSPLPNPKVNH
jgi:hypothetical protein